jgi:TPR repeat protein
MKTVKLVGKISALTLSLLLFSGCASQTTQIQDGKHAFQYHHYKEAFNTLLPLAKQGNAEAQYTVGYLYYYGKGVVEDQEKAQYWINKSAQQGNPLAIRALEVEATHAKPSTSHP